MARRVRKWQPIGEWLKKARRDADLTLSELARLTGVSSSALARFESNRAVPSFADVCVIAQRLRWPLLYFATGRERTGNDRRALAAQLFYWGLRDLRLAERVLLGEIRAFEELIAEVVAGDPSPRVLEALPALLLRNKFVASEIISHGSRYGSLRRLGWLAAVAEKISEALPLENAQPDARRWLRALQDAAAKIEVEVTPNEIDYLGPPAAQRSARGQLQERVWAASPPLTRRWGIACDIPLEQFLQRARSILQGG